MLYRNLRRLIEAVAMARTGFWDVGDVVRKLRINRGWKGADLARKARVDKSAISRLEKNGGAKTTVATLTAIAAALDVTVAELYRIAAQEPLSQELLARLAPASAKTQQAMVQLLKARKKETQPARH